MGKKLYVGNLSYDTTEDGLKEFFSQVGTVEETTIIVNRATGRSKGFGFVEMSTEEEAQNAMASLNGQELDGRNIVVEEARPIKPRRPRRDFRR
ncbi:RNA-binding protein [bacterium]|nr:RNA-binding protein [bacterium]